MAEDVIAKLELTKHPEFQPEENKLISFDWKTWLKSYLPQQSGGAELDEAETFYDSVVEYYFERLKVTPVKNSQLVRVAFEANDRQLAADVANNLANIYIVNDLEARLSMTSKASDWLTQRIEDLGEKLKASEIALQSYREREKLIEVGGVSTLTAQQLQDLGGQLVMAEQRRATAESSLRQINALKGQPVERLASIPAVLSDSLVSSLREAEAEAQRKVSSFSKRYGPKHPKMIEAQADLTEARLNVQRQIESVIKGVEKEYQVARENEQSIKRSLGSAKGEMQQINRKSQELRVLEREVEANRQLYSQFLEKMKEAKETTGLERVRARVSDPAVPAVKPIKPKKSLIVAIAGMLGLFLGVLLAFLQEHLDNTIKRASDLEEKLKLPLLGWLPHLKLKRKDGESPLTFSREHTHSFYTESIRTLRTAILLSGLDDPYKVIVVTSSVPGEGKSTVSMNLADSLGELHKVLLVDADMRRPTVAKTWGLSKDTFGLSEFVSGSAKISECVHQVEDGNIYVMPSGLIPPNPLELLSSKKFKEALDVLGKTFDHIIIDSAPTLAVSDALVLSTHASGVIYVVKADSTPYPTAQDGLKRLRQSRAHIIGGVLNDVPQGKKDSYGRYGKYGDYGGYYGSYGYTSQ
ncbi:MAG: hypothetical protein C0631_03955 [Sedimenticola sp.]|nr:MAG: hypothetical protein C0631_03955 [Sedimenticola sp.]